jgi:HAMP domain-containing protein
VVSILEDEEGNIWAATYNGLSCYRVAEGVFRNFYEEDGLSNNEFNYASSFKDEQGGMWFGGMNGVNYFDPKDILQTKPNPPLCLTGFAKYNSRTDSTLTQVFGEQPIGRFVISPSDSWFQFSWALPNYFKPDKNNYYVRLEGLEADWSYVGSTSFVRYNKLPPGKYILRVKGSDSKGNWSRSELAVPITVRPAFYQTWWFYLLVLATVAGIGYAISRYRLQRLLEMERMRTRIASDLHDEVGSMLSGLSMQAELLEMNASEKDLPRLGKIGTISRAAVTKMRDLVWSIDSRRDKVKDLLERMQEQAADLLQPNDITFHFDIGELPLEKKLKVDVRQHLFLIFKEALTNAVRHSNASVVKVRFGNFNGQFEMVIQDNGSSSKKDHVPTGMGLSNIEMRAEKLGAKLEVRTNEGFLVKLAMKPI